MCSFFPKTLFRSDWGRREGSAPQIRQRTGSAAQMGNFTDFAMIHETCSAAQSQDFGRSARGEIATKRSPVTEVTGYDRAPCRAKSRLPAR